ncbi:MAG: hypothetical protein GF398_04295 [Chitinivibrionales bacterium]|nr:hypothetical protein [Chitinivibrionales bacterium]
MWGTKDSVYSRKKIQPWSRHTSRAFEFIEIDGGDHLFINNHQSAVTDIIKHRLSGA